LALPTKSRCEDVHLAPQKRRACRELRGIPGGMVRRLGVLNFRMAVLRLPLRCNTFSPHSQVSCGSHPVMRAECQLLQAEDGATSIWQKVAFASWARVDAFQADPQ
jgi:hypothetical protein